MTATAVIDKPGVYELADSTYHAHPALSSSGARKLLPPSCPALFAYEREHGRPDTKAFDLGHAAHKLALGVGPKIFEIQYDNWRTNAAQDQAELARSYGGVPLLTKDYQIVKAMAAALLAHPFASTLFEPDTGRAEASLFWHDQPTGIMRRAKLDWLPNKQDGKRLVIPDYKTAASAAPVEFARSVVKYGYHQQCAWYLDAVTALDLGEQPAFVFVVQEKTAPYLVSVMQLDVEALRIGRILNRQAIDVFIECTRRDEWPGYVTGVELTSLPFWYTREYENQA